MFGEVVEVALHKKDNYNHIPKGYVVPEMWITFTFRPITPIFLGNSITIHTKHVSVSSFVI